MTFGSAAAPAPTLLPPGYRASGILLHITSLPGHFGVGDLGPTAIAWIDRLADAGQSWWQILPVGPPGLGHSPYDPLSTFAGNLMLVSPDLLLRDGLVDSIDFGHHGFDDRAVQFDTVKHYKTELLHRSFATYRQTPPAEIAAEYEDFQQQHHAWLDDFALFMAIKQEMDDQFFYNWPVELKTRQTDAIATFASQHADSVAYHRFCQFIFFRQWHELKQHAMRRGVRLLGDLPFFVSHDSAEVWANPDLFLLDADRHPTFMAGVPPDYFSATGQLWGNPVYDWEQMSRRGYQWWTRRLSALLKLVEGVRLDHFRAFCAAWHIPHGSLTAEHGEWVAGPGAEFFTKVKAELGGLPLIAEDLGLITEDVNQLRLDFAMPGMRVLQFAFDGDPENIFLPTHYDENCVAFTGTHDNDTTRGWFGGLDTGALEAVEAMFGPQIDQQTIAEQMVRTVWECKAALAIAPLQDLLNLGSEARMNVPGQAAGNWGWRVREDQLTDHVFDSLAKLTGDSGRWAEGNRSE
jgi:4-alpha-glucanotransferase